MAKRKSLFDDRPAEIQELTYIIKGDLNSLNQQIARLQEMSKSQRKTTNAKHLLSHSSNMVLALQAKLANMSTDFKQVLEVRTENLKQQKSRRDQVSNVFQSKCSFYFSNLNVLFFKCIYSSAKVVSPAIYRHHQCENLHRTVYYSLNRIKLVSI